MLDSRRPYNIEFHGEFNDLQPIRKFHFLFDYNKSPLIIESITCKDVHNFAILRLNFMDNSIMQFFDFVVH